MEMPVPVGKKALVASSAAITMGLKCRPYVPILQYAVQLWLPIVSDPSHESGTIREMIGNNKFSHQTAVVYLDDANVRTIHPIGGALMK